VHLVLDKDEKAGLLYVSSWILLVIYLTIFREDGKLTHVCRGFNVIAARFPVKQRKITPELRVDTFSVPSG
jgi:hypothetical protein